VGVKWVEGHFDKATDLKNVFTQHLTKNLHGNRVHVETDLPGGLALPDEYYQLDRPLWSPPDVGLQHYILFSNWFVVEDIWGKTLIWQDLIEAEISWIDPQMKVIINYNQILEASNNQGIKTLTRNHARMKCWLEHIRRMK